MSELSDAEKRRILRERRQQKFNNGGGTSRLNKITGQVPDSQLNTQSPLDNAPVPTAAASGSSFSTKNTPRGPLIGNEASTQEMDELIASISKPGSPTVLPKTSNLSDPSNPSGTGTFERQTNVTGNEDPQLDLFKSLLGSQQPQDGSTPDLLSFLSASNGEGKDDIPLPFLSEPVDQKMLDYHNYAVNSLKARSILFKWLTLFVYIYLITRPFAQFSHLLPHWLIEPSNFFSIFIAFEVVTTSIYYRSVQSIERNSKVNTLQNGSKIAKLVSLIPAQGLPIQNLRGKALLALQYWDVLSMLITDICFVLIAMGLCSYL